MYHSQKLSQKWCTLGKIAKNGQHSKGYLGNLSKSNPLTAGPGSFRGGVFQTFYKQVLLGRHLGAPRPMHPVAEPTWLCIPPKNYLKKGVFWVKSSKMAGSLRVMLKTRLQ